jgi:hypothetical protein
MRDSIVCRKSRWSLLEGPSDLGSRPVERRPTHRGRGTIGTPATAPAQTLAAVDPAVVSHTFTLPSLKINVPLLADSRTTFTFHTGAAGTFEWHCQDPCGTGPVGWAGAMSQQGYMGGELTVV